MKKGEEKNIKNKTAQFTQTSIIIVVPLIQYCNPNELTNL